MKRWDRRHQKLAVMAIRCAYCSEELATTDGIHCVYCGALLADPLATTVFVRAASAPDEPGPLLVTVVALLATLLIGGWLLARWSERRAATRP